MIETIPARKIAEALRRFYEYMQIFHMYLLLMRAEQII